MMILTFFDGETVRHMLSPASTERDRMMMTELAASAVFNALSIAEF
ncbi:MAG: hypothetical protein ACLQIQ_04040 [Beijerinckiaceae bacterium]